MILMHYLNYSRKISPLLPYCELLTLAPFICILTTDANKRRPNMASLIDPSGKKVVDELSILCRATGLHVSDNMAPLDMNRTLQGEWYRGSERFKIAGEPPKDLTLKILRALGLINEVRAPTDRDHYYHGA